MTIPCMRILARAGSSCPALYPPSRVLLRGNGSRTGIYANWRARTSSRFLTTMLHRNVKPDEEEDDFIPDLRDSLIEAIQKEATTPNRYIIFQATPSYSHLVSDPIFLRESIDRAVKTAGYRIERVEAVGVVIDSIPRSAQAPYSEGWSMLVTDRRAHFYGDTTAAYENFEFSSPLEAVSPDLQPTPAPLRLSRNPDDDRGSFQMIFRTAKMELTPEDGHIDVIDRERSWLYVKTKMANTLFQNGMPSTAMVHKYRVDGDEDGSNARLYPELVRTTKDLTVRLNGFQIWEARVNYGLRRLTEQRVVSKAQGNVIKALKVPNSPKIPASKELEAAVADWVVKRPVYDPVTLEKRPMEIFARIAREKLEGLGQRIPQTGVHFAKVLAGGGGWGLNAGLLALDPDVVQGYKPPEMLGKYLKELGDTGPMSLTGKWITFYANDPTKSTVKGRKGSSLGMWKFVMVGKGDTLGPEAAYPGKPLASNPIEETTTDSKGVATPVHDSEISTQEAPKTSTPAEKVPQQVSEQNPIDEASEQNAPEEAPQQDATSETLLQASIGGAPSTETSPQAFSGETTQHVSTSQESELASTEDTSQQIPLEGVSGRSTVEQEPEQASTEGAPQQVPTPDQSPIEENPEQNPAEATPAPVQANPQKHNYPSQSMQTGADTAIWINGHKMEIPMCALMLDLLAEVGEYVRLRFVGLPLAPGEKPTIPRKKWKQPKKESKPHPSSIMIPGLSLKKPEYDFEGEKYEREIQRARSQNYHEDAVVVESEDEGGYQEGLNVTGSFLTKLTTPRNVESNSNSITDQTAMIRELRGLHKMNGTLAELEAHLDIETEAEELVNEIKLGAASQGKNGQDSQTDGSVSTQTPPSERNEELNGLDIGGEKPAENLEEGKK
ncbi:hypothetical protein TWF481_007815 [Arthrobotrys musiformis]|uniref:Uncharacterized protein n=1 Tax=Arthrobotrys musiformis TaxID=47236 RepID=A0AAV9WB35_9PEZI